MQNIKPSTLVGVLLLLQMAGGIYLNFSFLAVFKSDIFTVDVSNLTLALGGATLIALLLSFINVMVGGISAQKYYQRHPVLCSLLVMFAALGLISTGFEYGNLGNYTAFISDIRLRGLQELTETLELIRLHIVSERNESHHLALLCSSLSLLFFYILLYRATQIARLMLAFAITACVLQLIALANTFFQGQVIIAIQLPLLVTQLVMPIYFIVFGFRSKAESLSCRGGDTQAQDKTREA